MYADKTYTRKISISILKYSTLYTRPTLHCSIYSVKSHLTYTLLMRALLLLVMYGFFSNKALYSASFSFTVFIGSATVAQWFLLKESVHSSFFPGIFLELDHQFFLNFGMELETQTKCSMTEPDVFRPTFFASNTEKMGQNWTKNNFLLNLLKKLVFNFH